jgi:hypothetical protein
MSNRSSRPESNPRPQPTGAEIDNQVGTKGAKESSRNVVGISAFRCGAGPSRGSALFLSRIHDADEHSTGILGWFRTFPPFARISRDANCSTDRELWKRIFAGDTEAFEAWYRKTAPRLHEKTAAKDPYCDFTRKCAVYRSRIYAIETAKLHLCIVPTCRCGDRRSYAKTINRILDKSLHL